MVAGFVKGSSELAVWHSTFGILKAGHELSAPVVRPKVGPVTIAVEDETGVVRKITKIVPYKLPDGGFAVMIPYHQANEGLLFKARIFDTLTPSLILPTPMMVETYRAISKAKLSFHSDGTTQFSSMNGKIISGRDSVTGAFKGLGIVAKPFRQPVTSGPTLGIDVWGLPDYRQADAGSNTMLFTHQELKNPFLPGRSGQVRIEISLLSRRQPLASSGDFPNYRATMRVWNRHLASFGSRNVRLIALHSPEAALAVFAAYLPNTWKSRSGFCLSSPRDVASNGLYAIYPRPPGVITANSLDYTGCTGQAKQKG